MRVVAADVPKAAMPTRDARIEQARADDAAVRS
jgi:hypothetical protein